MCFDIVLQKNDQMFCLFVLFLFSAGILVSSTNKTDRHDITELLLKVAFNTKTTQMFIKTLYVIEYLSSVALTPNVTVLSREMWLILKQRMYNKHVFSMIVPFSHKDDNTLPFNMQSLLNCLCDTHHISTALVA